MSQKAWLSFQHVLHEPSGTNHERLSSEWVSIGQIQLSIPRLCCFWFWQGLEAAQSGQTRSKCTARLSSFNWSLSLPCFWKTIVWDEALVSSLFTQTQVNYSQKGYMPASLVAKLRPTLQDPMDCSPPGSSIRFSRQQYWGGFPFRPPGDIPNLGTEPSWTHISCLGSQVFNHWATWPEGIRTLKSVVWQPGSQGPTGFTETAHPGNSKFKFALTGYSLSLWKMKWRQIPWKI